MPKNNLFVLIDTKTMLYKRYSGRTCVLKLQGHDELLSAHWIEVLRMRPEEVVPPEEPQLA